MVDYNAKNLIPKKIPFSNLYCVIPYYYNKFVNHVKNLLIIIFGGKDHKYVVN
jgi:hypothetical protein